MLEYFSRARITHSFRRNHIFLFAEIQYLSADKSRHTRPGEQSEKTHKQINIVFPGYAVRVENGTYYKHQRQRRQTHKYIAQSHYDIINDTAVIPRKTAHYNTERGNEKYGYETKRQRKPSAVHQTHENIHTLLVRAE